MGFDATLAGFLIALPPALAVAFWDLKFLKIPNWLTGLAATLFIGFVFLSLPFDRALWRLAGAALVLIVGFLFFLGGAIGGGDAKAAAAFAPMVAPADAAPMLVLVAAAALVGLALLTLLRRTSLAQGSWAVWSERRRFPYGVALSTALVVYLSLVAFAI
ncbi:MAG: prepilin peptidase [Paracoccaceae bacterium]